MVNDDNLITGPESRVIARTKNVSLTNKLFGSAIAPDNTTVVIDKNGKREWLDSGQSRPYLNFGQKILALFGRFSVKETRISHTEFKLIFTLDRNSDTPPVTADGQIIPVWFEMDLRIMKYDSADHDKGSPVHILQLFDKKIIRASDINDWIDQRINAEMLSIIGNVNSSTVIDKSFQNNFQKTIEQEIKIYLKPTGCELARSYPPTFDLSPEDQAQKFSEVNDMYGQNLIGSSQYDEGEDDEDVIDDFGDIIKRLWNDLSPAKQWIAGGIIAAIVFTPFSLLVETIITDSDDGDISAVISLVDEYERKSQEATEKERKAEQAADEANKAAQKANQAELNLIAAQKQLEEAKSDLASKLADSDNDKSKTDENKIEAAKEKVEASEKELKEAEKILTEVKQTREQTQQTLEQPLPDKTEADEEAKLKAELKPNPVSEGVKSLATGKGYEKKVIKEIPLTITEAKNKILAGIDLSGCPARPWQASELPMVYCETSISNQIFDAFRDDPVLTPKNFWSHKGDNNTCASLSAISGKRINIDSLDKNEREKYEICLAHIKEMYPRYETDPPELISFKIDEIDLPRGTNDGIMEKHMLFTTEASDYSGIGNAQLYLLDEQPGQSALIANAKDDEIPNLQKAHPYLFSQYILYRSIGTINGWGLYSESGCSNIENIPKDYLNYNGPNEGQGASPRWHPNDLRISDGSAPVVCQFKFYVNLRHGGPSFTKYDLKDSSHYIRQGKIKESGCGNPSWDLTEEEGTEYTFYIVLQDNISAVASPLAIPGAEIMNNRSDFIDTGVKIICR